MLTLHEQLVETVLHVGWSYIQ